MYFFPSGNYELDCEIMGKEFTDETMASGNCFLLDLSESPNKIIAVSVDRHSKKE